MTGLKKFVLRFFYCSAAVQWACWEVGGLKGSLYRDADESALSSGIDFGRKMGSILDDGFFQFTL